MARPKVFPVLDEDLDDFCLFLQQHFPKGKLNLRDWRATFEHDWCPGQPNHGFVLRDESGQMVGAIGAIYGLRLIRGENERFCNITCWCVVDEYKSHSMRLAIALTSQQGFHFTDFTPTKTVASALQFLKFERIDARQIWLPNLPALFTPFAPGEVIDKPEAMLSVLGRAQAKVASDHLQLPWLRQIAITGKAGNLHIVYKALSVSNKPGAFVLAVSDRALFTKYLPRFQRYLLTQGIGRMRFEKRFVVRAPRLAFALVGTPMKLFRSGSLGEADIDNLYSEVAALDLGAQLV